MLIHGEAGKGKTTEYRTWNAMWNRCTNPRNRNWKNYGGRGIKVCDRWSDYSTFLVDMGRKPTATHTLDRKDNDGNYEPGNCRWATPVEQQTNTRRPSVFITIDGETKRQSEWGALTGASTGTIASRLKRGAPPELAIQNRRLVLGEGVGKPRAPVTVGGISDSITGWARRTGLKVCTISWRLRVGFTPEQAISTELNKPRFRHSVPPRCRGEQNGASRLTEGDVVEIRRLRIAGTRAAEVAAKFKCSTSLVYQIEQGKCWAHVPLRGRP